MDGKDTTVAEGEVISRTFGRSEQIAKSLELYLFDTFGQRVHISRLRLDMETPHGPVCVEWREEIPRTRSKR